MSVLGLVGCDISSVRPPIVLGNGHGTFGSIFFLSSDGPVSAVPMSGTLGSGVCEFDDNDNYWFLGSSSCCRLQMVFFFFFLRAPLVGGAG